MAPGSTKTPDAVRSKVIEIINSDLFFRLYQRWQDEKEHEDIRDYGRTLERQFDCAVFAHSKEPFGFTIAFNEFPEGRYEIQFNTDRGRYRRVD